MNYTWVNELASLYADDALDNEFDLMHYGVAHDANPPGPGSGRYPFGSGDRKLQRHWDTYSRYRKLKDAGFTENEIAAALGYYQVDSKTGEVKVDEKGNPRPNSTLLRAKYTIAKNYVRQEGYVKEVNAYYNSIDPDTGKRYTKTKIGEILGINESSVRQYLNSEQASANASKPTQVAAQLKALCDENGMIDVGRGTELSLGVSPEGLKVALTMLKEEGYQVAPVYIKQIGGNKGALTSINTLYKPDMTYSEVFKNADKIRPIDDTEKESTTTLLGIRDPVRVDVSRVGVRYKDEGGKEKDGEIELRAIRDKNGELRPACPDLDMGNARYAQVRIAVDASSKLENGDRYIKGMAVYSDKLPDGVDILVNSNKKDLDGALKKLNKIKGKDGTMIVDPDNPFGSTVYQSEYVDSQGNHKLSALNIVGDVKGVAQHKEGAWDEWSRNLPAQFLSKQSEALIKQQLRLKIQEKQQEYDEIMKLNNPTVKKKLLIDFADGCDGASVDLKASPLPGQRVQVILPLRTIKPNEVFAPNYETGQILALIRYPHTGPFEIPIVKVNNSNKEGIDQLSLKAKDVIGMNHKTAEILSGADFDGDTVTVIPMTRKNANGEFVKTVNIKGLGNGQDRLPGFENFDPDEYSALDENGEVKPGIKIMDSRIKGIEMGIVSNLITDMSLKGCEDGHELARAVKYSMIVIDAEKHKYDYQRAYKDYNIQELKDKYQRNSNGNNGTSTIVSRAGSKDRNVVQRQIWAPSKQSINPETGEKIYKLAPHRFYKTPKQVKVIDPETGKPKVIGKETYTDKNGHVRSRSIYEYETVWEDHERKQSVAKMELHKNAYELLSDNPSNKEYLYADFANKMKSMANEARKEWLNTPDIKVNPEAKQKYAAEIKSLKEKDIRARMNAPRERQANLLANQIIKIKKEDNPELREDKEWVKKIQGQALNSARDRLGAKKEKVIFTEKEWEAINAGAIAPTTLKRLLDNGDPENYKALATPRSNRLSDSTIARIQGLLDAGWTYREIANAGYASIDTIKKVESGAY